MKAVAVTGKSMWPALKTGDLVFISSAAAPRPGDLIFFMDGDSAIVHRWLGPGLCKGDHEIHNDEWPRQPDFALVTGVIPRRRLERGGRVRISALRANRIARASQALQSALSLHQMHAGNPYFCRFYRLLLIANGWLLRLFIYLNPGEQNYVMSDRS